jgi:hypothetical protein
MGVIKIPNLRGSYRYMQGRPGALIPSESPSGQLAIFPSSAYKTAAATTRMTAGQLHRTVVRGAAKHVRENQPPFAKAKARTSESGMALAKKSARQQELARKKAASGARRGTPVAGPKTKEQQYPRR